MRAPLRPLRLFVAVGAMTVAALGCVAVPEAERSGLGGPQDVDQAPEDSRSADRWGAVSNEPALDRIRLRGQIMIEVTDELRSPVSGRVVEYLHRSSDPVSFGDPVVTIAPTSDAVEELQQRVLELESALAARPTPEVVTELLAARAAAAQRVAQESAPPQETVAVTAPTTGVVVQADAAPGARAAVGDVVATMGATTEVELHVTVPNELLDLFLDTTEAITVLGRSDIGVPTAARLADRNRIIANRGEADSTVVRLVFDEPPPFGDRDRVDVEASVAAKPEGLSVPASSLRRLGDSTFVLVDDDAGLRRVEVGVLLTGPDRVEVTGSLKVGDRLMLR